MDVIKDIPYGSHPSQAMDVYMPAAIGPNTNVFVYYHGGGWRIGDKAGESNLANGLNALKDSGYDPENTIMVSVEYRKSGEPTPEYPDNSPDIKQKDIMDDARDSFRAIIDLAATHGVSTESLGIGGTSAGAWISSNLITNPEFLGQEYHDKIDKAVLNAGVYDQRPFLEITEGDYGWVGDTELLDWYKDFVDGEIDPAYNAIDNVENIAGDDIEVVINHGELDSLAIVEQADAFYAGLLDQGIKVDYNVLENSGHGLEELFPEDSPLVYHAYTMDPGSRTRPETSFKGHPLSKKSISDIRKLKVKARKAKLKDRHKSNLKLAKAKSKVILDDVRKTKKDLSQKKFLGRASKVKMELAKRVAPKALSNYNKASSALQNMRALSGESSPGLAALSADKLALRGLVRVEGFTRTDGSKVKDHYRKI